MSTLKALWAYIRSFFLSEYAFEDYPVRVRRIDSPPEVGQKYLVQIINWWTMNGMGATEQEALANLRKNFDKFKSEEDELPRPGTQAPLRFASTEEVDALWDIASDFLERVLEFHPDDPVFISDESSLFDFDGVIDGDETLEARILRIYGVDVEELTDRKLVTIFRRIQEKGF